ncbi:MAG TPA: PBP1A family penicillin-binding protein [Pyrinomonadaceae bacterium]|jgi:penicillin-binding protein 1B|nr:PBP1A family penicillin-binding protein [Pyrinomonadaceae bacterium]
MSIEATSLPDPPRIVFKRRFVRLGLVLFVTALAISADAIARSYRYYSQIIDARLANGYLTSRPGLYAAPRVLEAGQKLSREKLVAVLRRAGYVESKASDVWSGSFTVSDSGLEIRPRREKQPELVRVVFNGDRITELRDDVGALLESFTLEPEILSTDLSAKAGKREVLSYGEIPEVMVHAILAIEDRRFFEHSGVDIRGLGRALLRNAGDERMGQGGSTITQQLVKNTYLTPDKTLQRKYAEAMLAVALERRLSKKDILALYSNEIYLGQRGAVAVRGIKEAAQVFYGKELRDVTLSEAATLAGMIQSPAHYSPLRHPDEARARRNIVLAAMQQNGWITSEQNAKASAESVTVASAPGLENSMAPYFVDYVNRIAESQFETSGNSQRIYTTIDLELQQAAEQALKRQLDSLDKVYSNRGLKPQASLVALDPHTGNILAMVGGRNYAETQLNRATDAMRQPGSTFKPFVYAAALEDGMSPVQMFMDAPREFTYDRDKIYRPANYGGGYSMREVTMRTGLVRSLNVVTVDVALQTGLARIANLANRFGLPKPERFPALALGTEEVTPLQLATAYAAFVNGGRRVEAKAITSVGEPPATHAAPVAVDQVVSPTTAYMITNMLAGVVERGTARKARGAIHGTAIAGKTGTSRDGWFVGYSPNLVCVVWIGFDDNRQLGLTGAEAALPAWVDFMNSAVALRPDLGGENFECPEGIKFVEIDSATGLISTVTCPVRELIAVTERTSPSLECYLHGNLPSQSSPFAEETEVKREEIAVKKQMPGPLKDYRTTRVDVDLTGRRALVNDMR